MTEVDKDQYIQQIQAQVLEILNSVKQEQGPDVPINIEVVNKGEQEDE